MVDLNEINWNLFGFGFFLFFDSFYLFNDSSKELLMLFQIEVCKSSNVAAIFSHIECAANKYLLKMEASWIFKVKCGQELTLLCFFCAYIVLTKPPGSKLFSLNEAFMSLCSLIRKAMIWKIQDIEVSKVSGMLSF